MLFMGFYENDQRNGLGISLFEDNKVDIGIWKSNRLIRAHAESNRRINPELNELHTLIDENELIKLFETNENPNSLQETDFITYTLEFISRTNLLSKTCFTVKYLLEILNGEQESNGPISGVIKRLFKAAEENDVHYIKTVLKNSIETICKFTIKEPAVMQFDVNLANAHGITALHLASINQNADAVQLLLSFGADPNCVTLDGTSCLTHCVLSYLERHSNDVPQGTHFIELKDGDGNVSLWNRAELEWSLNFNCQEDCDFTETSVEIKEHNDSEENEEGRLTLVVILALMLAQQHCDTFVKYGAFMMPRRFRARLKTVLSLLQGGADPNIRSQRLPPLIAAVRAGDLELVKLLIYFKAGANIKTPSSAGHSRKKAKLTDKRDKVYHGSQSGLTPLHFAVVIEGNMGVAMTQILLENEADPNIRADPDESFYVRFENTETQVMKSKCDGGRLALHLACARTYDKNGSLKIIKMLMDRGADPNLLCSGQSALSLSVVTANDEATLLLLKYPKTKPHLTLSYGLGSSLCLILHPVYERIRSHEERLQLLMQLIHRTPHGLIGHHVVIPNQMTEGNIVDYIYYFYKNNAYQDENNYISRKICKERGETLKFLAKELRESVFQSDAWKQAKSLKQMNELLDSCQMYFCYNCGRSSGVKLTECKRCRRVFFCSETCRKAGWLEWHGKQCLNIIS
nr:ankyrin repeat and MYND domain containing protein [Hymenolepis microstoma]